MEKVAGVQLQTVWKTLKPVQKLEIFKKIIEYQKQWLSVSFAKYGSLYFASDSKCECSIHDDDHLYTARDGQRIWDARFLIGPAIGRDWVDERRATLDFDRGPCKTSRNTTAWEISTYKNKQGRLY